jgi:Putative polyhydroxyalkanoic acid system protein (PHA_gran_rgn)
MKHAIPHDLDTATAKKVTDRAFDEYKARFAAYSPTLRWATDRHAEIAFSVKTMHVGGSMTIEDRSIDVDLDVPFLLRPFRSMALEVIDREVKAWIVKAHAGQI